MRKEAKKDPLLPLFPASYAFCFHSVGNRAWKEKLYQLHSEKYHQNCRAEMVGNSLAMRCRLHV